MLPSELVSAQSGGASRGSGFAFLDAAYVQSPPQAGLAEFLGLSAADVMEKEVVWAAPEDTVQDVIAKMQQHNVGYVLIGVNGVLEGLVSGSSILGAVSLYLRPMFAKWRRPQDDATLGVKVKWIMSRPVRTVRPDATMAGVIESMRRCGGRCLPVVDAKGAVQGIVTVFDILLRMLESDNSVSWKGRPPQAPPLMI
jgi:CBS domain-containing membrane protein